MPPIPGMPPGPALSPSSTRSATIAAVVSTRPATEAAFCSAKRTTLVGSMTRLAGACDYAETLRAMKAFTISWAPVSALCWKGSLRVEVPARPARRVSAVRFSLSREREIRLLCSVAVDLRVSNVVDVPNVTVSALLPEAIFVG